LSPFASSDLDRQAGAYLVLLTALYAWPLWVQDAWVAAGRHDLTAAVDAPGMPSSWARTAAQAAVCGAMVTAIYVLRSRAPMDFIYFAF
jgi:hypothetical protein